MTLAKNYLMTFGFNFIAIAFSYAQVNAIITYTYEWPKIEYKKEYQLIISNQLSNYQHHKTLSEFTTPQGYLMKFSKDYYDWYYDATSKKIVEQRVLKNGTKVIANWPADLTWEITEETKEIAGYKVQKAITQSHNITGRPSTGTMVMPLRGLQQKYRSHRVQKGIMVCQG